MNLLISFAIIFSFQNVFAMDLKTKALHVLNRFSYGPKPGEVDKLAQGGDPAIQKWFEDQLKQVGGSHEADIKAELKPLASLTYTNEQMNKMFPKEKDVEMKGLDRDTIDGTPKDILKELVIQKLVRATQSDNQLEEVLLDFWFNHFNVYFDKGQVRHTITSYERDAIRPHIFGNFKDMLMASAKSAAMMIYLDNTGSKVDKINENYARELFELHTLGVDGGYTQKDIQESARVLTGWGVEKPKEIAEFKFFKKQHDNKPKHVLNLFFKGTQGMGEGEQLIQYLSEHKSTAHFIAKKLAVKFISDEPSEKTVDDIAKVFWETKGDLKSTYRAVFRSEELWKDSNVGAKIKTPLEFLTSSVRVTESEFLAQPERINQLKSFFAQSGQELYRCVPPTGF
ncbi:MAG: DUF1800 domain-containing protein, partial [Pseudobdellovibrio sp.]